MAVAGDGGHGEDDVYRRMWEEFDGQGSWDFTTLEGNDSDSDEDLWSSSNTRNPAFRHAAPSSPSVEEFSSEVLPRPPPPYQPRHPPTFQPRAFRAASPRHMGNASSNHAPHSSTFHNPPTLLHRPIGRPNSRERRRRLPVADHSEYWLDADATRRHNHDNFDDIPSDLFGSDHLHNEDFRSPSYGSGIDIDELLRDDLDADEDMPTTRGSQRRGSVVDLTDSPTSPPSQKPISLKRSAEDAAQPGSSKRRRVPSPKPHFHPRRISEAVEELDLTNEAPSAEEELLQTQQAQLLALQRQEASAGPLKMGSRTCIICLDNITNATVTSCGHMFCHECLTQAILAAEKNSEKGVGGCPVCRKPVNRKKEKQMIPIAFMKRAAFKGKARRAGMGYG